MKHLRRSLALLSSFLLVGTAAACDHIPPASIAPAGAPANDPETQSHTPLLLEPAATEQLEYTEAFLEATESEVDKGLTWMRAEGRLDRRSMSKLQGALHNARGSMDRIVAGIRGGEPVDLWTARTMTFAHAPDPQRRLAQTLWTTGDLLRESALAIASNLNQSPTPGQGGDAQ
jgi:hypothetical protein